MKSVTDTLHFIRVRCNFELSLFVIISLTCHFDILITSSGLWDSCRQSSSSSNLLLLSTMILEMTVSFSWLTISSLDLDTCFSSIFLSNTFSSFWREASSCQYILLFLMPGADIGWVKWNSWLAQNLGVGVWIFSDDMLTGLVDTHTFSSMLEIFADYTLNRCRYRYASVGWLKIKFMIVCDNFLL